MAPTHSGENGAPADVAVVGAGVIGLAIAWQLVRAGRRVLVIDPAPGSGATHAAAGMLGAVSEFHHTEPHLAAVLRTAVTAYPDFLATLPPTTGHETAPTVVVGVGADDRQVLSELAAAPGGRGMDAIGVREARRAEPLLAPNLACAYRIETDHRIDPRALASTLEQALRDCGAAEFETVPVRGLTRAADRTSGVLLADGTERTAEEVVVTCGAAIGTVEGVPAASLVRPVYGEVLRLGVPEVLRPALTATVRALVRGRPVYLLPRGTTVVLGATQREDGGAKTSTGGVRDLLNDAVEVLPAVAELELLEVTTRARPGTPDNAPLVGRLEPGLVLATGTFRNGVLLAPLVAELTAALVAGTTDSLPDDRRDALRTMDPARFAAPITKEAP